jgi:hypothetical protein
MRLMQANESRGVQRKALQAFHVRRPLAGVDERNDGQVLGYESLRFAIDFERLRLLPASEILSESSSE